MVTTILKKEDKGLSPEKMYENVLPNFIKDRNDNNNNTLHYHEGHLGNCHERKDNYIGLDAKVHLTNVDIREGEKVKDTENEKQNKKLELPTCKQLTKKEQAGQQDELDLTAMTANMIEEAGKKVKDKSIWRRMFNWLNEIIHNYYEKKIAETYRREREEGNQFYLSTFYFIRPMTRADREQQKREIWLERDNQRRKMKKYLDSYWEEKQKKKEALRVKEEERYEKWASEHSATVSICSADEPKKRLSRWEERHLRLKEFVFQ